MKSITGRGGGGGVAIMENSCTKISPVDFGYISAMGQIGLTS